MRTEDNEEEADVEDSGTLWELQNSNGFLGGPAMYTANCDDSNIRDSEMAVGRSGSWVLLVRCLSSCGPELSLAHANESGGAGTPEALD